MSKSRVFLVFACFLAVSACRWGNSQSTPRQISDAVPKGLSANGGNFKLDDTGDPILIQPFPDQPGIIGAIKQCKQYATSKPYCHGPDTCKHSPKCQTERTCKDFADGLRKCLNNLGRPAHIYDYICNYAQPTSHSIVVTETDTQICFVEPQADPNGSKPAIYACIDKPTATPNPNGPGWTVPDDVKNKLCGWRKPPGVDDGYVDEWDGDHMLCRKTPPATPKATLNLMDVASPVVADPTEPPTSTCVPSDSVPSDTCVTPLSVLDTPLATLNLMDAVATPDDGQCTNDPFPPDYEQAPDPAM